MQLDSNDNLDLMWGDGGVAHILWCPDHDEDVETPPVSALGVQDLPATSH